MYASRLNHHKKICATKTEVTNLSCEKNVSKVGGTAAIKNGVSAMASKAGNVAGTTISALAKVEDVANNQVRRRAAPVSNALLNAVDRPAVAAARWAPAVAAAVAGTLMYAQFQVQGRAISGVVDETQSPPTFTPPAAAVGIAVSPRLDNDPVKKRIREAGETAKKARRVIGTTATVTALAGAVAVEVAGQNAQDKQGQRTLQLKKKGKTAGLVSFSKAKKLTRFLNRTSLLGSHRLGQNVVSSDGDVVRSGSTAWHRGTATVKTAAGQRTITHLQSLKLPAQRFYFDRKLSDQEVAGIVSGQEKAQRMKGYAAEISSMESLAPGWAATKKAMIITRLYHPPSKPEWQQVEPGAE